MAEKFDAVFERALKIALSERSKSNARKRRGLDIREREATTGERGQLSLADFRTNTTALARKRLAVDKRQGRRQLRVNERQATVAERGATSREKTGERETVSSLRTGRIFKQLFPELSGGRATKARGGATGSFDREGAFDRARESVIGSTLDDDLANLIRPRR